MLWTTCAYVLALIAMGWLIGKALPFRTLLGLLPAGFMLLSLGIDLLSSRGSLAMFISDSIFIFSIASMASCFFYFLSDKLSGVG